jgi:transposase
MTPPAATLPDDPAALKAVIAEMLGRQQEMERRQSALQRKHDAVRLELLRTQQELLRLKKQVYGPRADRVQTPEELAQLLLSFGEEWEAAAKPAAAGSAPAIIPVKPHARRRHDHGRRNLAEANELPTTRVVHELSPEARACPGCGAERAVIGSDSSFQLEHVPARLERIEHVQMKYACAHCETQAEPAQIKRAPKPPAAIGRCLAGPGLLAYIVTAKFHHFLPLYRLERIFENLGFRITRGTQSAWCEQVAARLEPLYQLMVARVRAAHVVATDDTIMPMQARGQTKRTRVWVYLGDDAHPYNVFDFTLGRGRDGPKEFLGDFKNTLLADAYGGYNGVVASNQVRRAGCHAHARRRFVDAQPTAPTQAAEALALYQALYAVEARARTLTPDARLALRRSESAPILATLHHRLKQWDLDLLPKHPLAEAVGYLLHQWEELTVFLNDGAVPIDNNVSEREMKRVVLNRKNSLFVGHEAGGHTMAVLASFTSTCFRHKIDPQRYLTQLLFNLPVTPTAELDRWLPDQWLRLNPANA